MAKERNQMPEDTPVPSPSPNGAVSPAIVEQILNSGKIARDESQRPYAMSLLSEYAVQVMDEGMTVGTDSVVAGIKQRIAQIDAMLSAQLNAIMHSPEFQAMEASWRGLQYLVMNTETGTMLKL